MDITRNLDELVNALTPPSTSDPSVEVKPPATFQGTADFKGAASFEDKAAFSKQVSTTHVALGNLGATPALDFSAGNYFTGSATANFTLPFPTHAVEGQAGCIEITQDGTGSRLITYATGWLFPGGSRPALSTAPNTVDVISYIVRAGGTQIQAILSKGFA